MNTEAEQDLDELRGLVADVLGDASTTLAAWDRLAGSDLTLVSVPESSGGSGGTLIEAAVVLAATAEAGFSLPLPETAWLAGWLAASSGRTAPAGPVTLVVGHDVQVEHRPDGRHLAGALDQIAWIDQATEVHVVLPEHGGVAVLHAGTDAPDLSPLGLPRGRLTLDHLVPHSSWHPLPRPAADVVAELELRTALARTVQISGACRATLDMTVRYAAERVQFGRPLSKYQVIQHYLARIAAQAHAVGIAARAAVEAFASVGADAAAEVHSAKAVASVGVEDVTSLAHQVHGAIGTTLEHGLHRRTMNLWAWRDDAGNEFEHASAIAAPDVAEDLWNHLVPTGADR
jgi:acyl-CoA dehydrogenase